MKILMIFQAAPLPPPMDMGSAKRNFPFLRENLKRHEVSVVSFGTDEDLRIFNQHYGKTCKHVRFVNRKRHRLLNILKRGFLLLTGQAMYRMLYQRKLQQAIDELVATERFDLIHCSTAIMGFYRFPKDVPLVGDTHNVEFELVHRMYLEATNYFWKIYSYLVYVMDKREELKCVKKFDAITTTTQLDLDTYRKSLPECQMVVIQNGIDPSFFVSQNIEPAENSMVFMGLMNWYPNQHALRYFLKDVLPKIHSHVPHARLTVVGPNPPRDLLDSSSDNVLFTGFVDDVRPYIARSQVFIIPLLIGGGIRGKALEAMAMKRAIVSTTLGCAGIHLKDGESALFADTAEDFASAVVRLFHDAQLRRALTEKAYALAVERFNWEAKGWELEQVYRAVTRTISREGVAAARHATTAGSPTLAMGERTDA